MSTDTPRTDAVTLTARAIHPHLKYVGADFASSLERELVSITEERDSLKRELEETRCRHGWRGSVPENGQQIATPCPACGARSLFIGSGGHLTCARVPSDRSDGCHSPSVETEVNALKKRAELAEQQLAASREAVIWERYLAEVEKMYGVKPLNFLGDVERHHQCFKRALSASAAKEGK